MDDTRETAVYLARLAERTKRYSEMVAAIKRVALLNVELTAEERKLLSVGYTNMFECRCAALRILAKIEQKEESKGNQLNVEQIKVYARKVETEKTNICEEVKSVLTDHVIPSSTSGNNSSEDHVFYHKMMGDAYMYCAESKTGDDKVKVGTQALDAYLMAIPIAKQLPPINATRLGLAFNLSVLYYDILDSRESARKLAKEFFDAALTEITGKPGQQSKESLHIVNLLDSNVTRWNAALINEGLKAVENNARGADAL